MAFSASPGSNSFQGANCKDTHPKLSLSSPPRLHGKVPRGIMLSTAGPGSLWAVSQENWASCCDGWGNKKKTKVAGSWGVKCFPRATLLLFFCLLSPQARKPQQSQFFPSPGVNDLTCACWPFFIPCDTCHWDTHPVRSTAWLYRT